MPNPWQQFKLWRDAGGPDNAGFHIFRWNDLTGERRAAAIDHAVIGALEFLGFLIVLLVMSFLDILDNRAYAIAVAIFFGVGLIHGVIMVARREAFWQLRWRELKAGQQSSKDNLGQLMNYAEAVRKGYER